MIGYQPKTGRPVDADGNLILARMYGPDPRSANGKSPDFESGDRGSTPRRGTKRGVIEQGEFEL